MTIETATRKGFPPMTYRLETQTMGRNRWSRTTQADRSRSDNRHPKKAYTNLSIVSFSFLRALSGIGLPRIRSQSRIFCFVPFAAFCSILPREDCKQKITKKTKLSSRNLGKSQAGWPRLEGNYFIFAFFTVICPGQDHADDAALEHRFMEIHEQSDRNLQQLHVAEELRLAVRMQNFDSL